MVPIIIVPVLSYVYVKTSIKRSSKAINKKVMKYNKQKSEFELQMEWLDNNAHMHHPDGQLKFNSIQRDSSDHEELSHLSSTSSAEGTHTRAHAHAAGKSLKPMTLTATAVSSQLYTADNSDTEENADNSSNSMNSSQNEVTNSGTNSDDDSVKDSTPTTTSIIPV